MSVARAYRRRGLGRRLLFALLAQAWQRGYRQLVLETTASWTDAIAFYRSHDFRPVAESDADLHFVLDL
jgi:ribosomal protein S18 acetylase RimI-like enzyme